MVPVYDPGPILEAALRPLLGYGVPVYVTDDGSCPEVQALLVRMARESREIRLSRFEENRGKGAAVMDAFRRAHAEGCTHALQVDSDGQHDHNAISRFLERSREHPESIVAGRPVYDASAPAGRRWGRYVNHAWVWLETLSFQIADSLCGFRVYPLRETLALMESASLPSRMDFDTEIVVRLHWRGVPVLSDPVRVTYPEHGVSHFDCWKDNLRISRMHARLACGMILRLPGLLFRRRRQARKTHWSEISERGSAFGLAFTLWCYRLLGRPVAKVLVELIVLYFWITGRRARKASRQYLDRLYASAGPLKALPHRPGWRDVYRHFRAFGASSRDTFLAWIGDLPEREVEIHGAGLMETLQGAGTGAIFLGAHLGSLEMLRAIGTARGLAGVNAIVYTKNAARFQAFLRKVNPEFATRLICISEWGPDTALMLSQRVEAGESLFIVGDRTPVSGNDRTMSETFLGHPARFPMGPLLLAHFLQCPVYMLFCTRQDAVCHVHIEKLDDRIDLPRSRRKEAASGYLQRYVRALEERCRDTPFQWFNFFDFWDTCRDEETL